MHRLLLPTLALAVAAPALAQGSMNLDKASPGKLGSTLDLTWSGATPGRALLVIPSLLAGPTPLSLVEPGDPRVLEVGLDLGSSWFVLPVTASSGSLPPLPIPNDPNLAGFSIRFQTVTAPGNTGLFGELSNVVSAQLGASGTGTPLAPGLAAARTLSVAIPDRDDNAGAGNFVIAGGGQGTFVSAVGLQSSERYDFRRMTITPGPNLTVARSFAATVHLPDGRTLLIGGVDSVGNALASCEVYDPATNSFSAVAPMPGGPRAAHDAALLSDGRVVVLGGTNNFADAVAALANAKLTTEIYNPATNTWANGPSFPYRVLAPDLTSLADGRVLASGGFRVDIITIIVPIPVPVGSVATCYLLNAGASSWSPAASMVTSRGGHYGNTLRLLDGRVLVTGGATSPPDLTQATAVAQAEVYSPGSNSWAALPDMAVPRALHSATLLPDGRVIIAGGGQGTLSQPLPLGSVQAFRPTTNTWQTLPGLSGPRGGHAAALTPDGVIVLFGGQGVGGTASLASVETLRP